MSEIYNGVDVYTQDYDYEDLKIAVCVSDYIFNIKKISVDYEDIARLTIEIRQAWEDCQRRGLLSSEEFAYCQKFAINYLYNNANKITEELR